MISHISELFGGGVVDPKTLSRQVWDATTARSIPGVGRALDLYAGLISQMPLDDVRNEIDVLTRPRLLQRPDPDLARATFMRVLVQDYLLHGNAATLVTVRDAAGWPAAVKWFPAHAWTKTVDQQTGEVQWWLHGRRVATIDVIHAQLDADPVAPWRGVGVVERYVRTLDRAGLQEESERESLRGGAVPSVAVIAPQKQLGQKEADDAADMWETRYGGPGRRPAMLPNGTQVVPLAWSPHDQQATAARQMSLTDIANVFNLDPFWTGAPGSSHTYKSPGPLFVNLLRVSLKPVITVFEDVFSDAWLPYGRRVQLDQKVITGDDFATEVTTGVKATGGPVLTPDEWRARNQLGPVPGGDVLRSSAAQPTPEPEPDDDDEQDPDAPAVQNGPAGDDDPEAAA